MHVTGKTKTFLDRLASWYHILMLRGKAGMTVATTAGLGLEIATDFLTSHMSSLGIKVVGSLEHHGFYHGQLDDPDSAMEKARTTVKEILLEEIILIMKIKTDTLTINTVLAIIKYNRSRRFDFMKKVLFLSVLVLVFCFAIFSMSWSLEGMVTKMHTNGNVVINKGLNAQIKTGMVFYVTRMSAPIAVIKVIQVDDYSSVCQIVETVGGNNIQPGDVIGTTPFEKPEPTPSTASSPGASPKPPVVKVKTPEEIQKEREVSAKEASKNFEGIIKKKTQIYRFKRGSGGTIKVNAFDTYNFLSTLFVGGRAASINPWYAATYTYGVYTDSKSTQNNDKVRNVQIEITYWDTEYLDAYATYYAYKEVINDPRQVKMVRENIYRQKGLDKFYVFQVKIVNPGPGAFQLAPFPWHFYLEGKGGVRLKADHYDEVLDKALNPNQAVNGYIYFSRYDKQGQPVTETKGVNIVL